MFQFVGTLYQRLAFSGGGHQRLHHAGETYLGGSLLQFVQRLGIVVLGRFQSQLLGGQVAYGLAVHGVVHRPCTGHHLNAFFLKVVEALGADSLNFRHNDVRLMLAHRLFQGIAIQHTEHFTFVSHLHGRGTCIRIAGHNILSFALGGNHKLFAQLSGTE